MRDAGLPIDPMQTGDGDGSAQEAYDRLQAAQGAAEPREQWPGQFAHWAAYEAMVGEHRMTGVYRDPVSGKQFPFGLQMKREPNREERRRLKRWRATGKVSQGAR